MDVCALLAELRPAAAEVRALHGAMQEALTLTVTVTVTVTLSLAVNLTLTLTVTLTLTLTLTLSLRDASPRSGS